MRDYNNNSVYFKSLSYTNVLFKLEIKRKEMRERKKVKERKKSALKRCTSI
jgi:tyrosyl-tRNA synthetase